jgi:nucleoside-diphosphate-sugar epimerase
MKIFVTGASGFLGLNVLKYMAAAHPDARIVAADLSVPEAEDVARVGAAVGQITFQHLDVQDPSACYELLRRHRPTHVLHGAALTLSDGSTVSNELMFAVNEQGTANLLGAAVAAGSLERCVVLSSSGVYDQSSDYVSSEEDHPLDLTSAYARSKRQAELMMPEFEEAGGFPIAAARIGPVYGPFERTRPSRPRTSLIRHLADCLLDGRTVYVSGTDMQRDWTHAEDIARALDRLLFARELKHRIYNVGAGVPISARALIDVFVEYGLRVCWASDGESADIVLDPHDSRKPLDRSRLRQETGFEARFDLRTGIADVLTAEGWKTAPLQQNL